MNRKPILATNGPLMWSEPTLIEHGFLTEFSQLATKLPSLMLLQIGQTCIINPTPGCT
jgi:hypothetical protein